MSNSIQLLLHPTPSHLLLQADHNKPQGTLRRLTPKTLLYTSCTDLSWLWSLHFSCPAVSRMSSRKVSPISINHHMFPVLAVPYCRKVNMTVRRNGEVLFLALKLKQTHSLVISDTVTATPRYIDKMDRFKGLRLDVICQ